MEGKKKNYKTIVKRVLACFLAFVLAFLGISWPEKEVKAETEVAYKSVTMPGDPWAGDTNVMMDGYCAMYIPTSETLPGTDWQIIFESVNVLVNDTITPSVINVKKGGANLIHFEICADGLKAKDTQEIGTKITIKAGSYKGRLFADATGVGDYTGTGIALAKDYTMTWNGSAWIKTEVTNYTSVTMPGDPWAGDTNVMMDGYCAMYIPTSETLPGADWQIIFENVNVLVNDTITPSVINVKKGGANLIHLEICADGLKTKATQEVGTKITIKAGSYKGRVFSDANGTGDYTGTGITLADDYTVAWNGTNWGTGPIYTNVTVNSLTSGYNTEFSRWNIFFGTEESIPGATWGATFETVEVTINGNAVALPEGFYKSDDKQLFTYIPESILGQDITENTTIVIAAGRRVSAAQGVGIELQQTITIYANAYGWSLEGFIQPPETVSLAFDSLDVATSYRADKSAWHFYMKPTVALPGNADQSVFWGVNAVYEGQEFGVHIYKALYNDTAFVEIPDSVIPKELTEEVTLTFKAGTCVDSVTGAVLILEEDFVLYGNKYGWATDGYITKPVISTIQIESVNKATTYNENTGCWHVWLNPETSLPGEADSTVFQNLVVEVDGKTAEQPVWKSAHEDTAFLQIPTSLLPSKLTKNTIITIKAGVAIAGDQKIGIQLQKDVIIYANQYGFSLEDFLSAPTVKDADKDVALTLDRDMVYGGNQNGIYLSTTDSFPVDESWTTMISAVSYDENSGIFYNDTRIDAFIKRYNDGKAYLSLSDIGITAKDHDKVTIKGLFALGTQGVIYKEASFYYNGKIWNAGQYEEAKPETYTQITGVSLNAVSGWTEASNRWSLYIDVEGTIPGEIDATHFEYLQVSIDGKVIDTPVWHSYQDTLFIPIFEQDLGKNPKDGVAITIKAGKALAKDMSTGIQWMKDFTVYTYRGNLSELKPTNDTQWVKTKLDGTNGAGYFNIAADKWYILFKPKKELDTEHGTKYIDFPLIIGGKEYLLEAYQDSEYLRVEIPASILPKDTMNNTVVELKEGAKGYANAGRNGVEFTSGWVGYVYNKIIGEKKIDKIEDYEVGINGVYNVTTNTNAAGIKIHHVYLKTDSAFPGEAWYEHYTDFVFYYNGKRMDSELIKSQCTNDRFIYFPIIELLTGVPKEGDIITIKDGTLISAGANKVTFKGDFRLIYKNGLWTEYIETDAVKPEKNGSIWEEFRFDEGYIPVQSEQGSWGTNDSEYSTLYSIEKHKDYTMKFSLMKEHDEEETPPMEIILRGTPVEEGEKMLPSFLNGYVISLGAAETENVDGEEVWQQTIHLWKNGINEPLLDLYRIHYATSSQDHAYFQTGKAYEYEVSIYNVTDTCVCIEMIVNGELIFRCYDDAGAESYDPAINEGTFAIVYGCPGYLIDDIDTNLTEVISAVDECIVGDEVQFAVTYPFVLEGSEFSVDKEGATITDGVFKATKAGTYTVSGSYNGTQLTAKTIVVKDAPMETEEEVVSDKFPVIPVIIAGGVIVLALLGTCIFLIGKKRRK